MNQQEQIIEYLKKFGSITPMEAFSELGITKLATRVSEMRRDGIEFDIERVQDVNKLGHTVNYCRYYLHQNKENYCKIAGDSI